MRELEKLTKPEILLLDRRRRGENQHEAAARLGIPFRTYVGWERKGGDISVAMPKLGDLTDHECCLLYRRRTGFTRERVAQELGVSKQWVTMMEHGQAPCGRLLEYWEV